jgi:hypothetical protein
MASGKTQNNADCKDFKKVEINSDTLGAKHDVLHKNLD